MTNDETYDVVIAGCGAGGLYTALNLPSDLSILMIAKTEVDECDSMLAQGGICVLHDEDDYQAFFDDTLRAGHGENRHESVDIMIRSSRAVINDLIDYGVDFARTETGELAYTREAAHSRPRICFHEDTTGKEITTRLLAAVRQKSNVEIRAYTTMVDIIEQNGVCAGIIGGKTRKAMRIAFARASRSWLPVASAVSTNTRRTSRASPAMRVALRVNMASSWRTWITCRFTRPASTRGARGARF